MDSVYVGRPEVARAGGATVVTADVQVGGRSHRVWYRSPVPLSPAADSFVVLGLFAAMRTGLPLRSAAPVSSRLLSNLTQAQDILHAWQPTLTPVQVEAEAGEARGAGGAGVGSFFSGGVDSFYTAIKRREEVTHLIFVHGFDIPLGELAFRARVGEAVREAAGQFGRPLLEVETNLRSFTDEYCGWGFAHGAALASTALLLSGQLRKVYVPASASYADLYPWGSHPLLDPLWGTEAVALVHDGCEAPRVEKAARLAACDAALHHLRVCWEYREGKYNCGRCEKCLRTMISLRAAGALERCPAFDRPLDFAEVRRVRLPTHVARGFALENLRAVEMLGSEPALVGALRDCLNNQPALQAAEDEWEENLRQAAPELAAVIPEGDPLILVDEDRLDETVTAGRRVVPFTERDGRYWGPPQDDTTAIADCERLRRSGARFLVVSWPAFWWLDQYTGWNRHLRERYPCVRESPRLIVFDLRAH